MFQLEPRKGDQRTKELEAACKTYSAENECLNNFKDGPFMWPASKIQVFDSLDYGSDY